MARKSLKRIQIPAGMFQLTIENANPHLVQLTEWSAIDPEGYPTLKGLSFRDDARASRISDNLRERVDIRERYDGLAITSTSWVGRIDVGTLRIAIQPKLASMRLSILLRYAYGIRDIALYDESQAHTGTDGLQDLLIRMLLAEIAELQQRGLARRYVSVMEKLTSPKGRILISELIHTGGMTTASLPCEHFERRADWYLNKTLRAGLEGAATLTSDRSLRRQATHLAQSFDSIGGATHISADHLDRAERALTRLTAAYAPALTLIRLLLAGRGLELESTKAPVSLAGFLFDMNVFFQRLLSRFLHEHLLNQHIEDEQTILQMFSYSDKHNPKRRRGLKPRPDFALVRGTSLVVYLDAKYRDVWNRGIPAQWLYQLSVYALASPNRTAIMLYASMSEEACDEHLIIRPPSLRSRESQATVIVRPVNLLRLSDLLGEHGKRSMRAAREAFANQLVEVA
jgi:5-methylcytosine-specific restriction enzyme subunit McrC